jgi:hypothetical protein
MTSLMPASPGSTASRRLLRVFPKWARRVFCTSGQRGSSKLTNGRKTARPRGRATPPDSILAKASTAFVRQAKDSAVSLQAATVSVWASCERRHIFG